MSERLNNNNNNNKKKRAFGVTSLPAKKKKRRLFDLKKGEIDEGVYLRRFFFLLLLSCDLCCLFALFAGIKKTGGKKKTGKINTVLRNRGKKKPKNNQ